jgi:transposase
MRGEERQQRSMLMVMNVEQRIPREHPLRRVKQLAEAVLQELSPTFDRMYSRSGRPEGEDLTNSRLTQRRKQG